jgi:ABC-2 type transport system ATP-binding protein
MSIEVADLCKTYGNQKAIDGISFKALPGGVLGFLGPNGAGKSTTMKILTCFIPQTSGTAHICGFDVQTESMEVRRHIGYLPEHNPLYLDMYVREALAFIGAIQKIDQTEKRINDVIERCGLGDEQNKKLGTLSKGYRQRVGLAQAILADPKVLILDEPTSGLDPNQVIAIRALIKDLSKTKTVVLSTHIMQEVDAICENVIIINKGKIVADDTLAALRSKHNNKSLENIFIELTGSHVHQAQII